MASALAVSVRRQICDEKVQGSTLLHIAEQKQLSYSTVRNIWKRFRAEGSQGLSCHYGHCGRSAPRGNSLAYRAALWLKRHHQSWGAVLIRLTLQERYKEAALPCARTLQRWFKAKGLYKPKKHFPLSAPGWAQQVHDIWQIDAKEQLRLSSGERVCYLSIVDEKSGCLLKAFVFPPLLYQ